MSSNVRTIKATVEIDVGYVEDRSGLSKDDFLAAILEAVEEERVELAVAIKIAAIHLFAGEPAIDPEDLEYYQQTKAGTR